MSAIINRIRAWIDAREHRPDRRSHRDRRNTGAHRDMDSKRRSRRALVGDANRDRKRRRARRLDHPGRLSTDEVAVMSTACRWCGGDTSRPGHDHTLRHQIWLFIAQVLWFS